MTWPAIRTAMIDVVSDILGCDRSLVRWASDWQPCNDLQVRLSVISETSESEARREVDSVDGSVTVCESKRAQIECLVETSNGEAEELSNTAQDLTALLRLALQYDTHRDALAAAGVALVDKPGDIRNVDYEDRESTYWVCARAFEIPIRATFVYTDPSFNVGEMTEVIGLGDLGSGHTTGYDVADPG